MKVYIEIPDNIMDVIKDRGYTQKETVNMFKTYIMYITSTVDRAFECEIDQWMDELSEEQIENIKQGVDL